MRSALSATFELALGNVNPSSETHLFMSSVPSSAVMIYDDLGIEFNQLNESTRSQPCLSGDLLWRVCDITDHAPPPLGPFL